jgi:DNA repair exonuclease SbcCD ATPase subunit
LSESSEQDLMSRLNELEKKMNNLNNTANALEDELESLQTVSRELKMADFVDKFGKYLEEIEQIKEDVSCELIDDLKNEQMKELVESRVKTVPNDLENLMNEYKAVRGKLSELRDEIRTSKSKSKSKSSYPD